MWCVVDVVVINLEDDDRNKRSEMMKTFEKKRVNINKQSRLILFYFGEAGNKSNGSFLFDHLDPPMGYLYVIFSTRRLKGPPDTMDGDG